MHSDKVFWDTLADRYSTEQMKKRTAVALLRHHPLPLPQSLDVASSTTKKRMIAMYVPQQRYHIYSRLLMGNRF
jgi:hypothetical protein